MVNRGNAEKALKVQGESTVRKSETLWFMPFTRRLGITYPNGLKHYISCSGATATTAKTRCRPPRWWPGIATSPTKTARSSNVKSRGLGAIDPERLQKQIDQVTQAYGLANPPTQDRLFNARFLPPRAERMPAGN